MHCVGRRPSSGMSTERLVELWSSYAGAVHTSHSHTAEHPKHRIILRTSRDMTPDEHAVVWRHVRDLAVAHGQVLDEQTRDASRLWFVPAKRDGFPFAWHELTGAPLDVDGILARVPVEPEPTATAPAPRESTAPAKDRRAAMALALGAVWPSRGGARLRPRAIVTKRNLPWRAP